MPSPKVSVCIDVYNCAEFLPRVIESALEQTLSDFELIVVDDCSTDDSYDVALKYAKQDTRIRVARNAANKGMVGNRNVCLRLAQGEFVKFVQADDYLCSSEALTALLEPMESNPDAVMVAYAMTFVQ